MIRWSMTGSAGILSASSA